MQKPKRAILLCTLSLLILLGFSAAAQAQMCGKPGFQTYNKKVTLSYCKRQTPSVKLAPGPHHGMKGSAAWSQTETQRAFFKNLKKLCGQQFEGETVFPPDKNHPLAGKRLVMSVETCGETELRIPFQVGEDKSRTWILTLTDQGLLFKHDHRHADGKPDPITMYGGLAAPSGTQYAQNFPADAETTKLIPEAATNVWTLQIDPEKKQFIYYLERHKEPRYKALFNLKPLSK